MANNKHETHGNGGRRDERDAGGRTPYGPGQHAQQSQFPPPAPGQQQSGYPAGPPQPGQPGFRAPSEVRAAPRRDEKAEREAREAQGASSIGAQIILDYNSEGSLGARGGIGGTVEENSLAYDAHLVALGLDPDSPTGPPPTPEMIRARREAEKTRMEAAARTPTMGAQASRLSSLAAGILTGDELVPPEPPPEGGNGGSGGEATAPVNSEVPAVSQSGTTLNCTMGIWTGEPTSYAYAWKLDDAAAGSDAATYEVQAGDVGKSATCVVTATNAAGSTAAPPSNAHIVT
jgi:hypothetical protein